MQRDRWSTDALAREALRNIFVRGSKVFPLLLLAVLMGTLSVLFMMFEAQSLRSTLAGLDREGRSVLVFTGTAADGQTLIRRASCDGLSESPGVLRAGLIRLGQPASVLQLGREVPIVEASSTLFPGLSSHQALVGSAIARPAARATLSTSVGIVVAAPAAEQPAGLDTNSALVVALDPTVVAGPACYVFLAPYASPMELTPILAAQLSVDGQAVGGRQVSRQTLDPVQVFRDRPSRFLPVGVGLVGAILAGSRNLLRGGELSTYRLSGTSPRSLAAIIFFEQAIVAGAGLVAGVATIAVVSQDLLSVPGAFFWLGSAFTLWVAGACYVSLPLINRSATALAKDR